MSAHVTAPDSQEPGRTHETREFFCQLDHENKKTYFMFSYVRVGEDDKSVNFDFTLIGEEKAWRVATNLTKLKPPSLKQHNKDYVRMLGKFFKDPTKSELKYHLSAGRAPDGREIACLALELEVEQITVRIAYIQLVPRVFSEVLPKMLSRIVESMRTIIDDRSSVKERERILIQQRENLEETADLALKSVEKVKERLLEQAAFLVDTKKRRIIELQAQVNELKARVAHLEKEATILATQAARTKSKSSVAVKAEPASAAVVARTESQVANDSPVRRVTRSNSNAKTPPRQGTKRKTVHSEESPSIPSTVEIFGADRSDSVEERQLVRRRHRAISDAKADSKTTNSPVLQRRPRYQNIQSLNLDPPPTNDSDRPVVMEDLD